MRILVGYESVMGNTREVAEAIVIGLRRGSPGAQVQCVQVGRLSAEFPDVDLLVLGAPTHFMGLPADRTRSMWLREVVEASLRGGPDGHQHLEPGAAGPGLREWLAGLPAVGMPDDADLLDAVPDLGTLVRPLAAAFDTRLGRPFAGAAARGIARALRHHGYDLLAAPAGFIVSDVGGPLRPGELERATEWGIFLGGLMVPAVAG